MKKNAARLICLIFLFCQFSISNCKAYSVLTHEAIIDASWEKFLVPLLKQRFPDATPDQLKEAHAYAYGGAVAPDMGYYPFGSALFTNLVHYARSGDFVVCLLTEARDINEYAFSLGALCHYNADRYGHLLGTNRSVPITYPKMRAKFGDTVTYAEDKTSHLRTEFSFDVLQTARGNYASTTYHDYIGFKVSEPVLERAFRKTYGLELKEVFGNFSLAVSTFRWSVQSLMPGITKVAWALKKSDIEKATPGMTGRKFIYKMKRANYYQEFGKEHKKPGIGAWFFSFAIRILPKVGPLKALRFKTPSPEVEKLYIQSFDTVFYHYTTYIKEMTPEAPQLVNIDYDTGKKTEAGEYLLADACYGDWVLKLKATHFDSVSLAEKQNILDFYSKKDNLQITKKTMKKWEEIKLALEELRSKEPVLAERVNIKR
ncbi:MAG: hypothetical protein JWQ30_789 [Sediminibacterium sp.]|nr:hypothetical protein [Sediminibacterium sp.]